MSEHVYLRPADLDRLAELVLELAQQLHGERARRIALEQALAERGLLDAGAVERAQASPEARAAARTELDRALEGLMRILAAGGTSDAPLR